MYSKLNFVSFIQQIFCHAWKSYNLRQQQREEIKIFVTIYFKLVLQYRFERHYLSVFFKNINSFVYLLNICETEYG